LPSFRLLRRFIFFDLRISMIFSADAYDARAAFLRDTPLFSRLII